MPTKGKHTHELKKSRIIVIDDHPIVRQGLGLLINREKDMELCGEAEDVNEGYEVVRKLKPDLVLIDLSLQGRSGIDLIKRLKLECPKLPVLVISMHEENLYAERTLHAGAQGYLMKHEAVEKIAEAIRKVLKGDIYLSRAMTEILLHRVARGRKSTGLALEDLTDREMEIFQLLGLGNDTRQIADLLHLSIKTVESHYANMKTKLHLRTLKELIHQAFLTQQNI